MDFSRNKTDINRKGFSSVVNLLTPDELAASESAIDELMQGSGKILGRLRRELAERPERDRLLQPELSRPALLSRELRKGAVYAKCQAVAAHIFGCKAHYLFDHAIFKMPGTSAITPWHQDQAYLGEHVHIPSLHFWIPFQDVDEINGTMRFADDRQDTLLPHGIAFASNPHLLKSLAPAPEKIHELRLKKGDISIHTNLALHATGPNKSELMRKAWVIHFGMRSAWHKHSSQLLSRWRSK